MSRKIIRSIGLLMPLIGAETHAMSLQEAKGECLQLGFERQTERYGECVLELYSAERDQQGLEAARERSEAHQRELQAAAARAEARKAQAEAQAEIARIRRQQSGVSMMQFGLELMNSNSGGQTPRASRHCFSQPNGVGGYITNCD